MTPTATNHSFSGEHLPATDRVPIWRDLFARSMLPFGWEPLAEGPFHLSAKLSTLPGLGIASMSGSGWRRWRCSRQIVADGRDDLVLSIPTQGSAAVSQLDREMTVRDGAAYLMRGTEPGQTTFPSTARFLTVAIPSRALGSIIREREPMTPLFVPGDTHALKLLIGYLELLQQGHTLAAPKLQQNAVSHVYDLAALAIGATCDAAEIANGRGVRAARLEAIRADILANLSQVRLSPKTVARRHGVSERHVHRLFEGTGETFGEVVTEARLKRAFYLLRDPLHVGKISDIAHTVGYGDLSTFNRAFRRRFGDLPSGVRASPSRGSHD